MVFISRIRSYAKFEKIQHNKRTMLLQVVILIITLIATKRVSDKSDLHCSSRKYQLTPVYDLYHSNFKAWLARYYSIPDIVLGITLVLWFTNYTKELFTITLTKVTVYYIIRLLSIASTYGYVSRRYSLDMHYNTIFNTNFSDLVISGHVGLTCILAIDVLKHGLCWQKNIATWLALLSAYINLAVGDHYSSDVILGAIIAILLQYSTLL